jgi:hypothetical protein
MIRPDHMHLALYLLSCFSWKATMQQLSTVFSIQQDRSVKIWIAPVIDNTLLSASGVRPAVKIPVTKVCDEGYKRTLFSA